MNFSELEKNDLIVKEQLTWASSEKIVRNPAREKRYERIYALLNKNKHLLNKSKQNLKILDLGCGNGETTFNLVKLFPHAEIEGVDISPAALKYAQQFNSHQNIKYTLTGVGDTNFLSQHQNYFDVIIFNAIIEHIQDDFGALEYLYALGAPHCQVIVLTAAYKKYWSRIDELTGHYRRYEPEEFRELVKKTKFKLQKEIITGFPFSLLQYKIQAWKTTPQKVYSPRHFSKKIYTLFYPFLSFLMELDQYFDFTKKGYLLIACLEKTVT